MKKALKSILLIILLAFMPFVAEAAPGKDARPVKGAFSWGADAGASIDMTGNDLSTIDFSAAFGYKRGWINFLGVGAGVDFPVSSSPRAYTFFASFHTNFTNRPTLLFLSARCGLSVNYLPCDNRYTGSYAGIGLGINLARSDKFVSYIIFGCTFRQRDVTVAETGERFSDLHYASVKLGISF